MPHENRWKAQLPLTVYLKCCAEMKNESLVFKRVNSFPQPTCEKCDQSSHILLRNNDNKFAQDSMHDQRRLIPIDSILRPRRDTFIGESPSITITVYLILTAGILVFLISMAK